MFIFRGKRKDNNEWVVGCLSDVLYHTASNTTNEYGFFEKVTHKISLPKDPIVFRYVNGGIQVITKWGIEAEDRLLAD